MRESLSVIALFMRASMDTPDKPGHDGYVDEFIHSETALESIQQARAIGQPGHEGFNQRADARWLAGRLGGRPW
jgi:hypothetical protein